MLNLNCILTPLTSNSCPGLAVPIPTYPVVEATYILFDATQSPAELYNVCPSVPEGILPPTTESTYNLVAASELFSVVPRLIILLLFISS